MKCGKLLCIWILVIVCVILSFSGCTRGVQEFHTKTVQGKTVTVSVPNDIRSDNFDSQAEQAASSYFYTRLSLDGVINALKAQNPEHTFEPWGNDRVLIVDSEDNKALLKIAGIGQNQTELDVYPDGLQNQGTDSETLYKRIGLYPLWAYVGANSVENSASGYKRFAFPIHLVTGEGNTAAEISIGNIFGNQQYTLLSDPAAFTEFYTQANYNIAETEHGFILRQAPIIDLQSDETEHADVEFVFTQENRRTQVEYHLSK